MKSGWNAPAKRTRFCGNLLHRLKLASKRIHEDEFGQLSIFSLLVILTMILSLGMITNVALITKQKLETQNAADGVTQSASTHMARGLNSITAANHVIGELQALVVLHHSLGGDALDSGTRRDLTPSDVGRSLQQTYALAGAWCVGVPKGLKPWKFQFDSLSSPITVQAAIHDSRVNLKKLMCDCYIAHAVGGMLYDFSVLPYIGPALRVFGFAIMVFCLVDESKLYAEWEILNAVEMVARIPLAPIKKIMQRVAIPAVYAYTKAQEISTPFRAEDVANEVGEFHLAEGTLFPGLTVNPSLPLLQLPVKAEPASMTSQQLPKSQLMRASTPWIQYWRIPMLQFGSDTLQLARFESFYVLHTQAMSLSLVQQAKEKQGIHLLILDGLEDAQMNKGQETWTKSSGSRQADKLFCIMGFALRDAPPLVAPVFFDPVNSGGVACFAQAMTYNANPQLPSQSDATQAQVGWDTLNWLGPNVPEWKSGADPNPAGKTPVTYYTSVAPEPVVRLNWQTMLVPATRVSESVLWQRGKLGRIMDRTAVDLEMSRTH